ncbi:uncharacterized protein J7T54_004070 [Emericellopsis cladophorae]|uniref:AB hydrolase-1 domain-containing protein n=1 Tax=Emericellopsis cladophorae TaxID=2686198 RepID=A0A9Q0BDE4_9HYPO|nr:uncharacterized protein J7T54_004070 [Emericellopsis cladophorae]KAI6781297.1 hypothetical protein J7T54_004070 [Emericellopsis cladophorae]
MIGTSTVEWMLIRVSILAFRYAPILYSIPIILLIGVHGARAWTFFTTGTFTALLLAEAFFYVLAWKPAQRRLRLQAQHPASQTRDERRGLFQRCITTAPDPAAYIQGWFLGADLDDVRRDNVREFLLWAFFDHDGTVCADGDEDELEDYVTGIEQALGRKLEPGRSSVKSLRLTFDEIETAYRGLLWYAVIFMVDQATHALMMWYGYQYHAAESARQAFPPRPQNLWAPKRSPVRRLSYWYHPHQGNKAQQPVVFFHGIGIGLLTYIGFLNGIRRRSNTGIIAIELLPISFRLTDPPPNRIEFVQQMVTILDHHRWDRVALVSHSYGSVLTTHALGSPLLQSRVTSVVLTDPVTIMLHLPHVAYNFTRRRPRQANEWQLWYFASTDPGVAHCLGRHFFWRENIIWAEDLLHNDRKVAVSLAGRDIIVNTAAVGEYLEQEKNIQVVSFPGLDHAQVFDDRRGLRTLVDLVHATTAAY